MLKPTDGKAMKHEINSLDVFDFFSYHIALFYDSCSATMVDLQYLYIIRSCLKIKMALYF